jgi:DNA invertase Pin-like site-specific DNA recombinase
MGRQNATTARTRRTVGYVRRSTDKQEQSIGDQKNALQAYAAEHGLRLSKFYVDDAISGTSTVGRRAFQQMIADAQSTDRRFDIIVVYDVKRFGRVDNDEAGYYRHILRTNGVEVRYVSENFSGDSTDDLLRPVKQWQARQESKDLSKVTIRGLLSKVQTGAWMGGTPPYGYDLRYVNADGKFLLILRFMPDGTKQVLDERGETVRTLARGESLSISKRDHAKLVLSTPDRVTIVKRIFQMYAQHGKGYKAVAETLNQEGIPTPRGPQWSHIYSGKWTDTTIRAILVNPIYAGDMVWNRRTDGRFHRISAGRAVDRDDVYGARLVPNSTHDWIIVRDAHPAIISRRLFERARARRGGHPSSIRQRGHSPNHGKTWNGKRNRFVLSGLMKCALCGSRYQGLTRAKGKKRSDGTRPKNYYYACGGYITKGRAVCQLHAIPQSVLEAAVIEAVLDFYRPYMGRGSTKKLTELVKAQIGGEVKQVTAARRRAQKERTEIQKTIDKLLDNITATNREFIDQRLAKLKERKDEIECRLDELERLAASQGQIKDVVSDARQFLSSLESTLHEGLPHEKLLALRQCWRASGSTTPATPLH